MDKRHLGALEVSAIGLGCMGLSTNYGDPVDTGAHTAWHRHLNGQTLHILDGCGLVQARGGPLIEVGPGDTIDTPPGEWHWHGAAPGHFMTHLALSLDAADDQTGPATEWGDHLTADEYLGY